MTASQLKTKKKSSEHDTKSPIVLGTGMSRYDVLQLVEPSIIYVRMKFIMMEHLFHKL